MARLAATLLLALGIAVPASAWCGAACEEPTAPAPLAHCDEMPEMPAPEHTGHDGHDGQHGHEDADGSCADCDAHWAATGVPSSAELASPAPAALATVRVAEPIALTGPTARGRPEPGPPRTREPHQQDNRPLLS